MDWHDFNCRHGKEHISYYVSFPNWIDQLKRDCASKSQSWTITLRWYPGGCKRSRQPADIVSARALMDEALSARRDSISLCGEVTCLR